MSELTRNGGVGQRCAATHWRRASAAGLLWLVLLALGGLLAPMSAGANSPRAAVALTDPPLGVLSGRVTVVRGRATPPRRALHVTLQARRAGRWESWAMARTSNGGRFALRWRSQRPATVTVRVALVSGRRILASSRAWRLLISRVPCGAHPMPGCVAPRGVIQSSPSGASPEGFGAGGYTPRGTLLVPASGWLDGSGVNVYSNGDPAVTGWRSDTAGPYGYLYQCVELFNRLINLEGWYHGRVWGNGVDMYANTPAAAFDKHPNGSAYSPVPGDAVVFRGGVGGYGHVAIVEWVSAGRLGLVEQNASPTGRTSVTFTGGTIGHEGSLVPIGVLHARANTRGNQPPGHEPTPAAPGAPPIGAFDSAIALTDGRAALHGWTVDPDDPRRPTEVHVYVDGPAGSGARGVNLGLASAARPDVGQAIANAGPNHGFDVVLDGLVPGTHRLWVYAINAAAEGSNSLLRSLSVAIASSTLGDLSGDGLVGCADLGLLKAQWGASGRDLAADLNRNGTVDVFDLSLLLGHWAPPAGEPSCS